MPLQDKTTLLFLTLFFFAFFIGSGQQATHTIRFIQGENSYTFQQRKGTFVLQGESFSIRFFCKPYHSKKEKYYSAKVAVLANPADTSLFPVGKSMEDNKYFAPGTGMAANESGLYDGADVSESGHHYLYYESGRDKRVILISRTKKLLELEWRIRAITGSESDLSRTELYFVIFIDNNLNNRIDQQESWIIEVKK
jgi:hypothetical protein